MTQKAKMHKALILTGLLAFGSLAIASGGNDDPCDTTDGPQCHLPEKLADCPPGKRDPKTGSLTCPQPSDRSITCRPLPDHSACTPYREPR